MKSNGLLKWLVIPAVLFVLFLAIRLLSSHRPAPTVANATGGLLTPEEMKALGIEGDTPHDTVATLVGQVKVLRGEVQSAIDANKSEKTENDRLHQRDGDIDQRIQSAINGERDRLRKDQDQASTDKQQTQSLLQDLQRRLDGLSGKGADLPVGLGLQPGDGQGFGDSAVTWIDPQDGPPADGKHRTASGSPSGRAGDAFHFPTSFGSEDDHAAKPETSLRNTEASAKPHATPVYTVPANATLIGSVAMTALIGRVPIDGTVNDPYPFKVLIGPDNLTANGIDLPDVAGAVVSGTASGDWTLSCVRGQIRSITFVFRDGTIRTLPATSHGSNDGEASNNAQANSSGNANNGSASSTQGGLGWISDPYGIPCVAGERRSNAQQYLGTQALITAAGAGAASLIKTSNGNSSYVSTDGTTIGTVGISGNEAMGRILQGGVQDMAKWVNKLYGQAFAAVYVRPGAKVAVHIDQPLTIDYDAKGRKVRYRAGDAHAPTLD